MSEFETNGSATAVAEQARNNTVPGSHPGAVDPDTQIDRAFLLQMGQLPFIAAVMVLINWGVFLICREAGVLRAGALVPLVVVSAGMILAAIIDGWAFKVPNWLTLSLVLSGWAIGLLHNFGVPIDSGVGGIGASLMGTLLGFALLFPMLLIGGMGQGDVKMQMGFGAWVGAFFGYEAWKVVVAAFCVGALVGGVFAIVMILLRMQFKQNLQNVREIGTDLRTMVTDGPEKANERAYARRDTWVRLPYGVPLCVGFIGYLCYALQG